MRQTLFFIPHELAGLPVFGFGWLLLLWLAGSLALLAWRVRTSGWTDETRGFLPFIGIVALVIAVVLPNVELGGRGLPIRGYGVMLLCATVTGVLLAIWRAKQVGLSAEVISGLAFHLFVGGIVGARLFYVIQYWDLIYVPFSPETSLWRSLLATVWNVANFVEGGLVVYGSLFGASAAGLWFVHKQKLPALAVGDLIAPSLAVGLAIGRIGCLMNGCCFGDVCQHDWCISFPQGSPPYLDQHRRGMFHGFRLGQDAEGRPVVARVDRDGPAADAGVPAGASINAINGRPVNAFETALEALQRSDHHVSLTTDQGRFHWSIGELPPRSLRVHPTQIYSSINAAILGLMAYALFPFRRRDGEVFAILLGLYAITRFMLEVIRTDEDRLWNTGMTISQNVSLVLLVGVVGLFIFLSRQPPGSFWLLPSEEFGADTSRHTHLPV